jgi:tetratricopeptide (TPR) repeat protein
VDQYPTDLNLKYEYGRRLFASGQLDDAIGMLQHAQRDPKRRVQAMTLLGQSFNKKGWYREAVDTYSKALELDVTEERSKDLRYSLGCALRAMGEKQKALDQFSQVAQVDFTYRDVRKQIEDLRKEMTDIPGDGA